MPTIRLDYCTVKTKGCLKLLITALFSHTQPAGYPIMTAS